MARKPPSTIGAPVNAGPRTWIQTDRAAHEAWGRLAMRKPHAAGLLHQLVALMQHQNAVCVSQKTLAKIAGCSRRTVQRAIDDLAAERWIQVVRMGATGTVNAYIVNSAVAWGEKRHHLHLAVFSAQVIADAEDQPADTLERKDLHRIPTLYPNEQQMPIGDGEPPPSDPALPGLEPDLPAIGNAQ